MIEPPPTRLVCVTYPLFAANVLCTRIKLTTHFHALQKIPLPLVRALALACLAPLLWLYWAPFCALGNAPPAPLVIKAALKRS